MKMSKVEYYESERYYVMRCNSGEAGEFYLAYCGIEQCSPGYAYSKVPIAREHYHLHIVLSGKGIVKVEGKTFHLSKNQAFLLKPDQKIFYQADNMDPWKYCWIVIDGSKAVSYLESSGFSEGVYAAKLHVDGTEFEQLIERLLKCTMVTRANDIRRTAIALEFISLLMDATAQTGKDNRRRHDYTPEIYLQHALSFISLNYQRIGVNDIAQYIGVNRSYLTRIFTNRIGVSPQQYLLDYRLGKGRDLLETTEMSVTDIAQKIGYDNPLTFSKMFKRTYGISPRNYRNGISGAS